MIKAIEWKQNRLFIIDQTKLPGKLIKCECKTPQQVAEAIVHMKVRGAPAIGVVAAFGVYLGIKRTPLAKTFDQLVAQVDKLCVLFGKTRPTAVNLFWALDRMKRCAHNNRDHTLATLRDILLREAMNIYKEDERVTKIISEMGAELIRDQDTIMTHCNAGALATAGVGTALGIVVEAARKHEQIKVLVGETRPRLQGAHLTAWELKQAKIPFHLITDNMAAYFMQKGMINVVIVGADRVAMNGDVANKIGTYGLAILAYHHHIPFYVAAPVSTFDRNLMNGEIIPIEERDPIEVTMINDKPISVPGVRALNPAFDVTPHRYISAIVTELGIIRAPFEQNLKKFVCDFTLTLMPKTIWVDNQKCFACGKKNPVGLHLEFTLVDNMVLQSEYTPKNEFQGYCGIVHGGFLGLLLDEVMVNLPWQREKQLVVTAKITVRLHHPSPIGETLIITSFSDGKPYKKFVPLRGEIHIKKNGLLVASGWAKCIRVN